MRLAVLMTCHNRKVKTIKCIETIYLQNHRADVDIDLYLVDDGSTDGTYEVVQSRFPKVRLIKGNGTLYWNRGMRIAFDKATEENYHFYVWLNDDTELFNDSIERLLKTYEKVTMDNSPMAIVVGSMSDLTTGKTTYGGLTRKSHIRLLRFELQDPKDIPLQCETMNGNCVLISREVVEKLGNLDSKFSHGMGDFDYGLRANKLEIPIWIAPDYIGTCSRNENLGTFMDKKLSLHERIKKMRHIKGLPFKEWKVFCQRYAGPFWFLFLLYPYLKVILESLVRKVSLPKK